MTKGKLGLIILKISILILCHITQHVEADLYSESDDVLRLNASNFIPSVFHKNKNTTYMVQFYNSFCGHCQMFAPIYKDLASRIKNWTSVVRVAGIDCSKDENLNTCSENKIDGYPTILIFPPNARVQDSNDVPLNLRSLNIEWTVDDIEEAIVDYVANLTLTNRQIPLAAHALHPIAITNPKDLHRLYPLQMDPDYIDNDHHNLQDFMFIVETEKSYLGRKLVLEYYRISSKLELRRILTSNKILLRALLSEDEFAKLDDNQPVLLRLPDFETSIRDGRKGQVLVRGEAKHVLPTQLERERQDFIHQRFRMFFEHFYSIELKEHDQNSGEKSHFSERPPKLPRKDENEINNSNAELEIRYLLHSHPIGSKRIFAMDLLKGITYMITHEIIIKGNLNAQEYGTMRNMLTILSKYLPLGKWDPNVNKFVTELRTRLDNGRGNFEKNGISAQEMRDLLELSGADAIRLRYSRENWVSCLDSDRQGKGYTCSLWLLFHSLTVGEFMKAPPVRVRPTLVLYTMRDYITKFLGCTVCSSNFKKETESLDSSLNGRNSSVLWLWFTHNHINQRLNNENQKDKRPLIDVLFPSHRLCPQCIKGNVSEVGQDGKTLADIEWNQTHVLNYLIDFYRPDQIVSPKDMASLLASIRSKVNYDLIDINNAADRVSDMNRSIGEGNLQGIFSISDISLCLLLYIACIIIVAVVCVALNPKLKRFKAKL